MKKKAVCAIACLSLCAVLKINCLDLEQVMSDVSMDEVERLLCEWAIWVWQGAGTTYSRDPLSVLSSGSSRPAAISDEDAIRIEKALARLRQQDRFVGGLVLDHYKTGLSYIELGVRHGTTRQKISNHIAVGKAFICGALTNLAVAA